MASNGGRLSPRYFKYAVGSPLSRFTRRRPASYAQNIAGMSTQTSLWIELYQHLPVRLS
jgi:hypothetical protein